MIANKKIYRNLYFGPHTLIQIIYGGYIIVYYGLDNQNDTFVLSCSELNLDKNINCLKF